jgi:hypothetical protein
MSDFLKYYDRLVITARKQKAHFFLKINTSFTWHLLIKTPHSSSQEERDKLNDNDFFI